MPLKIMSSEKFSEIGFDLQSNPAPVLVNFDREYTRGTDRPRYSDREQPDGPATGNGHSLCRDLPCQHRVNGVPQRIKNRCILLRYLRIELPDVRFRNHHKFGECPVRIHANNFYVLTDVCFAGAALQALAASHVHFCRNKIALLHAGDFVPTSYNFAAKFVARNQRRTDSSLSPA